MTFNHIHFQLFSFLIPKMGGWVREKKIFYGLNLIFKIGLYDCVYQIEYLRFGIGIAFSIRRFISRPFLKYENRTHFGHFYYLCRPVCRNIDDLWRCSTIFGIHTMERLRLAAMKIGTGNSSDQSLQFDLLWLFWQ